MGLGPLVRAGEVVTVDLEALHGGRPLPMLDPKVMSYACGCMGEVYRRRVIG